MAWNGISAGRCQKTKATDKHNAKGREGKGGGEGGGGVWINFIIYKRETWFRKVRKSHCIMIFLYIIYAHKGFNTFIILCT